MSKKQMVLLLTVISFVSVKSQNDQRIYENKDGDYFIFSDNYVEYKLNNIIGGGEIKYRGNKMIVKNDIDYMGGTKSFSEFKHDTLKGNIGSLKFVLQDEFGCLISSKDVFVSAYLNNGNVIWANYTHDSIFLELYLKEMPSDSLIYIDTYGYYPLKIKLNSLNSGTYNVTLIKNQENLFYEKVVNKKIVILSKNDKEIICVCKTRKKSSNGKSSKERFHLQGKL